MADVQGMLTRKLGPLPVWGWAAAAGGLVSVFYLSRRGAAAGQAQQPGQDQASVPYVPSPIIVTPPTMADGTSSVNPASPPAAPASQGTVTLQSIWGQGGGVWIFSSPDDHAIVGVIPSGTSFPSGGPPIQGGSHSANGVTSSTWQPIKYTGGITAYAWGPEAVGSAGSGGGGSASSVMSFVPGSGGGKVLRHSGPHAHPQYLNVGMGGGGHGTLKAIHQKTGVPMPRLMSLNPRHWQRRPGGRPGHVHIA